MRSLRPCKAEAHLSPSIFPEKLFENSAGKNGSETVSG
ncbi:hypothetical protein AtDm6_3683 [Acetobacter tropicalis]|uniref:Uncharacterized protein n=1 Tax=Acetobacter tropicalis TaxID=104102 RepID=A0A094ZDC6_9PROT|nr:hypothetical protein AtDm6_3683 [Acetobacter tropicalis]